MTDRDVGPLEPDLRGLMDAERQRPDPPDEMRRRVRAGVLAAAAAAVPLAAGAAVARSGGWGARLLAHPLRWIVATVAVGTVAVVGVGQLAGPERDPRPEAAPQPVVVAPEAPPVAQPPAPVAEPSPASPVADPAKAPPVQATRARSVAAPAPPPQTDPPIVATEPETRPAAVAPDSTLAVERAMLERARRALAQGRPAEALRVAAMHQRRFPDGRLAEERERLRIQALIDSGDRRGARAHAEEFRRRYPQSIFLPAIEAALGLP